MHPVALFFLTLAGMSGAFVAVFLFGRAIRNYSIVDIAWSAGFAPVAAVYALFSDGRTERRVVLTVMVTLWSLRLALHLARRIAEHHPEEDARYARLRQEWGGAADRKMFVFFQAQAWLLVVLSVPYLLAARDTAPGWRVWEFAGIALWAIGLAGETMADRQLARFRAQPGNRGKVCDTGLWGVSRHPNYFFEWLIWVGFALFAAGAPLGWLGWISPALMLWFLLKVTGIRYTEEQSLRTKGEAYREYQRRTPAFFPWFPRRGERRRNSDSSL